MAEGRRAGRPAPAPPARRQAAGGGVQAKRTGADLQNGWLARHGDLILTEERLVFVPTLFDTALLAKRRQIMLEDVRAIERFLLLSAGIMPRGGRRPRMLLHTDECVYEFMVGDLDAWIDLLERYFQLSANGAARAPRPSAPRGPREPPADGVNSGAGAALARLVG